VSDYQVLTDYQTAPILTKVLIGNFLAHLQNCKKWLLALSYLSVCMDQLVSHWTDFNEIWYFTIFQNLSRKFKCVCVCVFACGHARTTVVIFCCWSQLCKYCSILLLLLGCYYISLQNLLFVCILISLNLLVVHNLKSSPCKIFCSGWLKNNL